ncbi:MAG: hypothetical protein ABW223_07995, partial [Rariglobus sp.]
MKALPLLLAASLVANAALVTVNLRRPAASDMKPTPAPASTAASSAGKADLAKALTQVELPPELVEALNHGDAATLRDFLRSAGLSDDMVRSIVQMRIWKNYEARFKAANPHHESDPNKPWWKDDRRSQDRWNSVTKAQREESRRLQREVREESERVLGPDANSNRHQDARLSFLAPEKRAAL